MASIPQTYTISDFIDWNNKKQLVLDPSFQRGVVWTDAAKVFLIDTILNDLPIPQVYFRTKIAISSQQTIREVVDGQQRLRSILEFASGKLKLSSKSPSFLGKTYSTLDEEAQSNFLSYKIPVVQLMNASDADVLEVFARLNSYSVKVTAAELRHAQYDDAVKWSIYDATRAWSSLWNEYHIVGVRDSVRLKNNSLMAEMFMIADDGLVDGGEANIDKYYKSHSKRPDEYFLNIRERVDLVIKEIIDQTAEDFNATTFYSSPNFLMLFAAVGFIKGVFPENRNTEGVQRDGNGQVNWRRGKDILAKISQLFDGEPEKDSMFYEFLTTSKSSTQRISSRKIRFKILVEALS